MKKKLTKIIKNIVIFIIIFSIAVLGYYGSQLYFEYINSEVDKLEKEKSLEYTYEKNILNNNGMYVLDLDSELTSFLSKKDVNYFILKIQDEEFYMEISIEENTDGKNIYNLEKIVDKSHNINARVNKNDIISIEFQTSKIDNSTVIKINDLDYDNYFVITNNTYYFLGEDIESISFLNDRFYYISYNPKYYILKEADECSKELKNEIENYNSNEYFYKYGKINFLSDYYQKLASKSLTVNDWCKTLKNQNDNN